MSELLQLAYAPEDANLAKLIGEKLNRNGYRTRICHGEVDPQEMVVCLISENTKRESLLNAEPWLSEQFDYSSYHNFRVLPLLPYHAKDGDIEEIWEEGLGEFYESLFSGEFKPYGWDLDDENAIVEFRRVLEEYE